MSTGSFSDFVLEQLAALDGRRHLKTYPDTSQDYSAFHAAAFTPSEKKVLPDFRAFSSDMPKDVIQLTSWAGKGARP